MKKLKHLILLSALLAFGLTMASVHPEVIHAVDIEQTSGTKITLPKTFTLFTDTARQLPVTVEPSETQLIWESSDTNIVYVDQTGEISAYGREPGTATVTAYAEDGKVTATCLVTVKKTIPIDSLRVDFSSNGYFFPGDVMKMTVNITPTNATYYNLTWKSDDPSIATVDQTGTVTAKKPGTTMITAYADNYGSGISVTVADPYPAPSQYDNGDEEVININESLSEIFATETIKDGIMYHLTKSHYLITYLRLYGDAKKITIPAKVKMYSGRSYPVKVISDSFFRNNKKLKTVVIGKNVTKIESNAFRNDKNLKKIIVKGTKIKKISKTAFKKAGNKKTILKVPKKARKRYTKMFKRAGFKGKIR